MSKEVEMVYDHDNKSFKAAIGVTEEESAVVQETLTSIVGSYACGTIKISQTT